MSHAAPNRTRRERARENVNNDQRLFVMPMIERTHRRIF